MDWQEQQSDTLTINGRFLKHYIVTMERMQDTFEKPPAEGLPEFSKFVMYLKSSIADKNRVAAIEREIAAENERVNSPEFASMFPEIEDTDKQFIVAFRVVNGCMKYVISAFNISNPERSVSGESGLLLEHYLSTMEKMQKTFAGESTHTFNLFIHYLRSIITDDQFVKEIDEDMLRIRKSHGDKFTTQQEWELGFTVIAWTQRFLDKKMAINKKQVKVLADQSDERMPTPLRAEDLMQ